MKNQSDMQVEQIFWEAYNKADTGRGNPSRTSGTHDLTADQAQALMQRWEKEGGTAYPPERRLSDQHNPNGYMLIHLNYKQNSYHLYLIGTESGGKRVEDFKRIWPDSDKKIIVRF